jgi:hypothetical protein
LQYSPSRIVRLVLTAIALIFTFNSNSFGQQSKNRAKPAARRISFAEAQRLLANEPEGNLAKQQNKFSRTKLSTGQVLELYYPITAPSPTRRSKMVTAPGYGVLYESEAAFKEANRPRHVLEDLIPDAHHLVSNVPQLVAKLEKRLRVGAGKLDYSRASLKRVDAYLAGYLNSHSTMQTDPQLFQELTAYYGETLRRTTGGQWRVREERIGEMHGQAEPNIVITSGGRTKEIKPWSGLISALYDENKRGVGLTKVFDADVRAAE